MLITSSKEQVFGLVAKVPLEIPASCVCIAWIQALVLFSIPASQVMAQVLVSLPPTWEAQTEILAFI